VTPTAALCNTAARVVPWREWSTGSPRPLLGGAEVAPFTNEAGRLVLARLLEQPHPPSAVFAAGEVLALSVLQEAHARQLDVPAQLALCGYTDSPTATLVQPPLTMVSTPAREIGIRAMKTLANLIQGKTSRPRRTTLPVELILRESCGRH